MLAIKKCKFNLTYLFTIVSNKLVFYYQFCVAFDIYNLKLSTLVLFFSNKILRFWYSFGILVPIFMFNLNLIKMKTKLEIKISVTHYLKKVSL
ncbi:MAG: hypothetical protein CBB92_09975 [Flammeovirgaceae bacterium TMED32]|nr:MAG: hypothetical protein CBB92_09975 [Flammeovirgaceae bacterium TMED32]